MPYTTSDLHFGAVVRLNGTALSIVPGDRHGTVRIVYERRGMQQDDSGEWGEIVEDEDDVAERAAELLRAIRARASAARRRRIDKQAGGG